MTTVEPLRAPTARPRPSLRLVPSPGGEDGGTMPLIYRAVWVDNDHNPIAVLEDEFRRWCELKGIAGDDVPYRGREQAGSNEIDVRRGDAEFGRILRMSLRELDGQGRTWMTTATAVSDLADSTYWVDVDCEDPSGGRVEIAAPRLVRQILDESGTPMRGPVRLSSGRQVVLSVSAVHPWIDLLFDPDRDIPLVIFSPDATEDVATNDKRATAAAGVLAGLAVVVLVSPTAINAFNAALPEGFRVYGGAARLYLPQIAVEDADDSVRHRYYSLRQIQHGHKVGLLMAQRLANSQRWCDPPRAWDTLRALVTRPSDEEVRQRQAEIARSVESEGDDGSRLRAETEQLLELLLTAEAERDALQDEMGSELARLRDRVDQLQDENLDDAAAMEELVRERDALRRGLVQVARGVADADGGRLEDEPRELDIPLSPSEAIELAQIALPNVVVPDEAVCDIERLDESTKDRIWAATTWDGLLALNDYASAVAQGEDTGGFYVWCQRTHLFQSSKIAMVESESVRNEERLARRRILPIDTEVEPAGRVMMQSHLKIQVGGGPTIPRLYFYDDTAGVTGKVHVGFYGPHDLMPNTRTN